MKALKNKSTRIKKINYPWVYSLVFFLFLLPQFAFSQLTYDNWATMKDYTKVSILSQTTSPLFFRYKRSAQPSRFKTSVSILAAPSLSSVPSYLDFQKLGWFCTFDLHLDKTMKMPLRFRLGSLDYVNKREGYYRY